MVNGKGKLVIPSLLFVFSSVMACACFMLVTHFVVKLVGFENKMREEADHDYDDDEQQVPANWDRFGVAFFSVLAIAFVFIAVFSASVINSIIDNGTKVVPAPTSVDDR